MNRVKMPLAANKLQTEPVLLISSDGIRFSYRRTADILVGRLLGRFTR